MKWQIQASKDGAEADIHINDFIGDWLDSYWGFGVTSKSFISELQNLPESVKTVRLHVNSPGGDVAAATHIANTIRDQQAHKGRKFEVLVEGAAWSAATIITSAGNPTKIADNAIMMTHLPWGVMAGNAEEMRKTADTLDTFRDSIIASYQWKSPLSVAQLTEMMVAETWMGPDEAIANGFADSRIDAVPANAVFDVSKFPKGMPSVPAKFAARVQALLKPPVAAPADDPAPDPDPTPTPAPTVDPPAPADGPTPEEIRATAEKNAKDIVAQCAAAGVPEAASVFLEKGMSVDDVKARLADAEQIRARCRSAKLPARANAYIIAGLTAKEVGAELFDVMVARQSPEIDNHINPEAERRSHGGKVIDYKSVFKNYAGKK